MQSDNTIKGASEIAEKEFEKKYPAIYNHLLTKKEQLKNRNKSESGIRYEWYALQRYGSEYSEVFIMKDYITIETHRSGYSVDQCGRTLSLAELIDYLSQWDENTPVYFSNDNGYTYGSISFDDINSEEVDEDDE